MVTKPGGSAPPLLKKEAVERAGDVALVLAEAAGRKRAERGGEVQDHVARRVAEWPAPGSEDTGLS
jgi:hypothetical protein